MRKIEYIVPLGSVYAVVLLDSEIAHDVEYTTSINQIPISTGTIAESTIQLNAWSKE